MSEVATSVIVTLNMSICAHKNKSRRFGFASLNLPLACTSRCGRRPCGEEREIVFRSRLTLQGFTVRRRAFVLGGWVEVPRIFSEGLAIRQMFVLLLEGSLCSWRIERQLSRFIYERMYCITSKARGGPSDRLGYLLNWCTGIFSILMHALYLASVPFHFFLRALPGVIDIPRFF